MKQDTPTIITAREFTHNVSQFGTLAQNGQSFTVTKNGKEFFTIAPPKVKEKKKYTMADLRSIRFSSGDPSLSKNIDKIVYGV